MFERVVVVEALGHRTQDFVVSCTLAPHGSGVEMRQMDTLPEVQTQIKAGVCWQLLLRDILLLPLRPPV